MTNDDQGWRRRPDDRLPPPAFPSRARRHRAGAEPGSGPDLPVADDAPKSAEAAHPENDELWEDAIITPEEAERPNDFGPDEAVVTGMSGSEPEYPEAVPADAIDVREAADILERLAHGLRERGPLALLVEPDTGRFESVLRGFLAGYLGGLGDDPDLDR